MDREPCRDRFMPIRHPRRVSSHTPSTRIRQSRTGSFPTPPRRKRSPALTRHHVRPSASPMREGNVVDDRRIRIPTPRKPTASPPTTIGRWTSTRFKPVGPRRSPNSSASNDRCPDTVRRITPRSPAQPERRRTTTIVCVVHPHRQPADTESIGVGSQQTNPSSPRSDDALLSRTSLTTVARGSYCPGRYHAASCNI